MTAVARKKAVVLLSGGIDSTVTLACARAEGFACFALSFRYGQRHVREIEAASRVAKKLSVERHAIIQFDLRTFGGSALTSDMPVPKNRSIEEMQSGVPVTYVPARNTVFLSFALSFAEAVGARDIFFGANAVDYAGYPDCRPEFLRQFEKLACLATKAGIAGEQFIIHTPLIKLSKADIIAKGVAFGVDLSLTHSCFDPTPDGMACGECDPCRLRIKGFEEAGLRDPVPYVSPSSQMRV